MREIIYRENERERKVIVIFVIITTVNHVIYIHRVVIKLNCNEKICITFNCELVGVLKELNANSINRLVPVFKLAK